MPKPGSKLRLRNIDPSLPDTHGVNNPSTWIWISLVKKLTYATGSGPTYQKKTMHFDNSMANVELSERKVKVRRVFHIARGLYPDDPAEGFDLEDRAYEYIDVEDIQEFSIREMSGGKYLKTTFVLDNPDGIAETRADAVPIDPDGRKSHRVRIYKQIWIPAGHPSLPAPKWYGVNIPGDEAAGAGASDAWVDIERLDEFTTTTGSGGTYQKTHWKVIWDDENDTYKDAFFDRFLFGVNLTDPPDLNGDPIGEVELEDPPPGRFITVKTDKTIPETGRGWRLDPFQNIVNVRWSYQEPPVPFYLFFYWQYNDNGQGSGGDWGPPMTTIPEFGVPAGFTGVYRHLEFDSAGVAAMAAVNDGDPARNIPPYGYNFHTIWNEINLGSDGNSYEQLGYYLAVSFFIPPPP